MKKSILFIATIIFSAFFAHSQTLENIDLCMDTTCNETINATKTVKSVAADSSVWELVIGAGNTTKPVTSAPRKLGKDEPLGKSLYAIKGVKSGGVNLGYKTITISLEKDAVWADISDDVTAAIESDLWRNPKGGRDKASGDPAR